MKIVVKIIKSNLPCSGMVATDLEGMNPVRGRGRPDRDLPLTG